MNSEHTTRTQLDRLIERAIDDASTKRMIEMCEILEHAFTAQDICTDELESVLCARLELIAHLELMR